ncbi:MAG: hypothetical protein ACRCXT_00635 [Paraclostridium sp.]
MPRGLTEKGNRKTNKEYTKTEVYIKHETKQQLKILAKINNQSLSEYMEQLIINTYYGVK